jgi:hypothetical protein
MIAACRAEFKSDEDATSAVEVLGVRDAAGVQSLPREPWRVPPGERVPVMSSKGRLPSSKNQKVAL